MASSNRNLPTSQSRQQVVVAQQSTLTEFQGPLPHPDILQKYNEIVPGAAERILAMAESQSAHRQGIEKAVIASEIWRQRSGLWAGLVVAISGLALASYVAWQGNAAAATVIGSIDLAGIVSVFVVGSHARKSERVEKTRIQSGVQT